MKFTLLLLTAGIVFSQPAAKKPETVPTINAELRAKYWKSQADAIAANANAQKANTAVQAILGELQTVCGDKYTLSGDPQSGEPICVAKPEQKKEEGKAPEKK